MTGTQMIQFVCTSVLFITVILAGVFSVECAGAWLRNKREERANGVREAESRISARYDRERDSWLAILTEKDNEIRSLTEQNSRLNKNLDIATRVLAVAERKGE